jgi:hypothetical protein
MGSPDVEEDHREAVDVRSQLVEGLRLDPVGLEPGSDLNGTRIA